MAHVEIRAKQGRGINGKKQREENNQNKRKVCSRKVGEKRKEKKKYNRF